MAVTLKCGVQIAGKMNLNIRNPLRRPKKNPIPAKMMSAAICTSTSTIMMITTMATGDGVGTHGGMVIRAPDCMSASATGCMTPTGMIRFGARAGAAAVGIPGGDGDQATGIHRGRSRVMFTIPFTILIPVATTLILLKNVPLAGVRPNVNEGARAQVKVAELPTVAA